MEVIIKSVDKLIEIQNARVELDKINKLESARASLRIKKIRDQNEDHDVKSWFSYSVMLVYDQ